MSLAVRARDEAPEFSDLLPGVADENFYLRQVPRYVTSSPAIEQAEAAIADMEARIASIDARRMAAIEVGDGDAVIAAENDRKTLPVALHAAKIRLALAKSRLLDDEAARVDSEGGEALGDASNRIIRLQRVVLEEAARVRQATNSAAAASEYLRRLASEAESEVRRLRKIDPTCEPEYFPGPRLAPSSENVPSSSFGLSVNGAGDVIGVIVDGKKKPLTQADEFGNDVRVDGYRVRADGVLISETDEPIAGRDGIVRRVASIVRR